MSLVKIVPTADGSDTIYSVQHNAHYHSLNGALQESRHIFINNGFDALPINTISILEVGFGTGLNAALTSSKAVETNKRVNYTGIELYPLEESILSKINYCQYLSTEENDLWNKISTAAWELESILNPSFSLIKHKEDICKLVLHKTFDLIYFDAFAPEDQPEIWTKAVFEKLFNATNKGGILVTYCSKGLVKQALRSVGYIVKRLPGPPGKRHILRATKD